MTITPEEKQLLNIIPRTAAGFSFCCASYMIWTILRSKYYINRIYHRIMLGCGFNIMLMVGVTFWGSAAAPVHSDVLGASGTQVTCSIQGFLHYFSMCITPLYYCTLSLLSYIAIRKRFKHSNILWIEKYMHCAVIAIPFISASYILSVDGYNTTISGCRFASTPVGCGSDFLDINEETGQACTRGPENITLLQFFFAVLPGIFILMIPTVVMILLYLYVYRQGRIYRDVAVSVALQSAVYLVVMFAIYLFRVIDYILLLFNGKYIFLANLLANTFETLNGVWILLAYLYFRSDKKKKAQKQQEDPPYPLNNVKNYDRSSSPRSLANIANDTEGVSHTEAEIHDGDFHNSASSIFQKPEFSIFDGNNVSSDSPWAAFLSEGIDEDYEEGRVWQQ